MNIQFTINVPHTIVQTSNMPLTDILHNGGFIVNNYVSHAYNRTEYINHGGKIVGISYLRFSSFGKSVYNANKI